MLTDSKVYPTSVQSNLAKLTKVNDVASLVNGAACGILQLEGVTGFAYYVASYLAVNVLFVIICCQSTPTKFFESSKVFLDGVVSNLAGFIMMWCLTGALVKV